MKFKIRPHITEVEYATTDEFVVLLDLLRFLDPSREKVYEYRQGTWDGRRECFLDPDRSRFATGHLTWVLEELAAKGVVPDLEYLFPPVPEPVHGVTPDLLDGVILRDYQLEAIKVALERKQGVIHASPRSGKTEVQAALTKLLGVRSLLLVEKSNLLQQHYERFRERGLGDVGRLGDGHKDLGATHIVATLQTLHRAIQRGDKRILRILEETELLQLDECHHGSAETYFSVLTHIPAPYRLGYSGTPLRARRDGEFCWEDFQLQAVTGPVIYRVTSKQLRDQGYLVEPDAYMLEVRHPRLWHVRQWPVAYTQGITQNNYRNQLIVEVANLLLEQGETVLILVKELEHGYTLLRRLSELGVQAVMSYGGNRTTFWLGGLHHSYQGEKIKGLVATRSLRCIIGSTIYDEGVDLPSLTAVVIGTGGKSPIKTIQRAFRAMTSSEGKSRAWIVDFTDHTNFMLRSHSTTRREEYVREDIPLYTALPSEMNFELRKRLRNRFPNIEL